MFKVCFYHLKDAVFPFQVARFRAYNLANQCILSASVPLAVRKEVMAVIRQYVDKQFE